MVKFLRDLFSTADNKAWEIGRVLTGLGAFSMIGLQIFAVVKGQPFSPSEFGLGFGGLAAGTGGLIAMKDRARTNSQVNVNVNTEAL